MNRKILGSLQVALAAVCWSFAGVFCKWLPWQPLTVNGVRTAFAAVFLILMRRKCDIKLTRGNLLGALGVAGTGVLFILATKLTSAANAIVLQYAMPAVVIAFSWIFLRQKPSMRDVVTALVVLAGVVLCSWTGLTGGGNALGDGLAILSAVTWALVFFCAKMKDANSGQYTLLGLIISAPLALCAIWDPNVSLEPMHWLGAAAMGLCLAGGYFFVARGMENTSPMSAALLANLEPILNPVWVFLFLGEAPDAFSLVGAVVVLTAATVYTILQAKESE